MTEQIAKTRIFRLADTILENRTPQFFGENKEYVYASADDEHWTIEHSVRDFDKGERDEEEREGVYVTGWKRYKDLGLKAFLIDYNGVTFSHIEIVPIIQN